MANKTNVISMLEDRYGPLNYEDMKNSNLALLAADTLKCTRDNRMLGKFKGSTCQECWENLISIKKK